MPNCRPRSPTTWTKARWKRRSTWWTSSKLHWKRSATIRPSDPPRLEVELGIPGVRVFALRTYPYVIVSFDTAEFVDVRHVLHSRRDIPNRMTE